MQEFESELDLLSWSILFSRTQSTGRSLQARLREMIVSALAEGWIRGGSPVPSSRELATRLDMARNTVLLAYQQLVDEGVLVSHARRGYFVATDPSTVRGLPRPAASAEHGSTDWQSHLAIRPSLQRNIAKHREWMSYPYPFVYGQFDPTMFPANDWRECVRQALSVSEIRGWAADLIDGDDPELVEQIRTRLMPRRGVFLAREELMITMGAQQALYLLAELLVGPDTCVAMEEPGYPDARNIFSMRTKNLLPVPVDEHGILPDAVPPDCRILFLTPGRQCPTGVRLSPDRRKTLLDMAEKRGFLIIEDDYESNFGLTTDLASTFRSEDGGRRVIYIGTLSKTLAPGLRFGFMAGPEIIMHEARALRRLMLRHAPTNNQRALALFIALGHFDRLLKRRVETLASRSATVGRAMAAFLPCLDYTQGPGSSCIWVKGPEHLDAGRMAREAQAVGVLIEPGDAFFMNDDPPLNYFRLGFASIGENRIEPGIELIGKIMADMDAASASSRAGL